MLDSQLPAQVQRWIDVDPDDEMIAQLRSLYEVDPEAALALFDDRISFGTAGLRAPMGPGPKMMNRVVVCQTTAGLMRWLGLKHGNRAPQVLIGFDARHRSAMFAADVAKEVTDAGAVASLFDEPVPTPVAAHELLVMGADAAVVITASHNPPADNGYKLYLGDGIQLVSPDDHEIASIIDQVVDEHLATGRSRNRHDSVVRQVAMVTPGGRLEPVSAAEAIERHRSVAVASLRTDSRDVQILYTAMHGVGGQPMLAALSEAGFPAPTLVDEQFDPDPEFSTTPFPNPEEPGDLDLAYQTAEQLDPDVIMAHDPDADRLAVAVPTEAGWRRLTGDEVGALLADHLLRSRSHRAPDHASRPALVASSIVSSRLIDKLAASHGVESIRTLTGFKWVARPIVDRPDADFVFGYEEALGYCVTPAVRDKDGISAGLVFAEIAAECKEQSGTLVDRLDRLARDVGLFATSQVSIGFGHLGPDAQSALRARAASLNPDTVAGIAVVDIEFLDQGRNLPPTTGVVMDLADKSRVIVRPSGTEPKIKAYLEVIEGLDQPGDSIAAARQNTKDRLARLEESIRRLLVD